MPQLTLIQSIQNEYLNFQIEPTHKLDLDVLSWWKEQSIRYPVLNHLARQILSIPATSGAIERLFSKCGIICNEYRSRMTVANLSATIFLKANFKLSLENQSLNENESEEEN